MFDYLQKYNSLPKEIRDKLSMSEVMANIEDLEKSYGFNLAGIIMKTAIKDINVNELENYLIENFNLNEEKGSLLSRALKEKVFIGLSDYLGMKKDAPIKSTVSSENKEDLKLKPEKKIQEKKEKKEGGLFGQEHDSYFSQEEEKEINDLAKKVDGYAKDSSSGDLSEEELDSIVNEVKISFGSKLLSDRFRKIIKIYVKGIRGKLDTKLTLTKSLELGGLSFDEEYAEKVLMVVDGHKKEGTEKPEMMKPRKIEVPEDMINKEKEEKRLRETGIRDVDYDFSSLKKKTEKINKLDTGHELAPPPPSIVLGKSAQMPGKPEVEPRKNKLKAPSGLFSRYFQPKKEEKKEGEEKISETLPKMEAKKSLPKPKENKKELPKVKPAMEFRRQAQSSGKVKMEDVKFQPKVMGPIDELRYFSLINFRRLDEDPFVAAEKIKEKIEVISEEYSKRLEGIKAWRLSPVNALYLKMGEASISKRMPIDGIIKERKASGKDYLSPQEFEAIIKLNKRLRF